MIVSSKYCKSVWPNINLYVICRVEAEDQGYLLHISGYSGTAGDSMTSPGAGNLNGMKFSTPDRDNDKHGTFCAKTYKQGWWFNA